MSDYVFQAFDNVSQVSKSKSSGESKMNTLKLFVIVFCFLLVVEMLVYFLVIPCLQTVNVAWSGSSSYSEQELNHSINPMLSKNFFSFDSDEAIELVSSIAGIESVQIVKSFPDKIYINVIEREPVAMTFVNSNGRTLPVQIDKSGVLFTSPSNIAHSDRSIPLISGIPLENIPEGMRIPLKYRGLMDQIASIRKLSQNYFAAVSEIHVVPKEYGNYELVLYPVHSKTRILTGRQLNEEALQYMMVALDVVNTLEPDVEEIDLRYGSVAFRTRNQ